MLPVSHVDLTDPHHIKRSQMLPSGKAPAQPQKGDRTLFTVPLSAREQQVINQRKDGVSFEKIAVRLGCSLTATLEYYRRALSKLQRTTALANASLEKGDRKATAKPEPALAEPPRDRPASALAFRCTRSPFHPPAQMTPAFRPNPPEQCVSSLS